MKTIQRCQICCSDVANGVLLYGNKKDTKDTISVNVCLNCAANHNQILPIPFAIFSGDNYVPYLLLESFVNE